MKKIIAMILSLVLLVSLCACGNTESAEKENADKAHTNEENTNKEDTGKEDADKEDAGEEDAVEDGEGVGATIDIGGIADDMDFSVGGIEVEVQTPQIDLDLDLPDFDLDLSIEPIEVQVGGISFEFADHDFSFDPDTFDVGVFVEESSENFSEDFMQEIGNLEVEQIVVIAESRANLLADLSHAFKTSGLAVTVDEENGEIMLDSSVLFAFDESEISPEGKEFLRKFLAVYTTIVFNPKYEGFVSQVLVEGHTDSDGSYSRNRILSQERAESVMAFCLSEDSGVEEAYIDALEDTLEAIGYSSDKLIYDADGNEDKAASRRVSFRFLIALPE